MLREKTTAFDLNSRGVSLAEVMVAVGFLAITVTAVMTLINSSQKGSAQATTHASSACLSEAHRILGNIKEKSIIRTYVDYHPAITPGAFVTNPYPSMLGTQPMTEYGIADAVRWNGANVYTSEASYSANTGSIYPSVLVMGAMTALDAIFRDATAAAVCSSARGINAYGTLIPARDANADRVSGIQGAAGFLKIQPYSLASGALLNCNDPQFNPVYTRPQNANRTRNAAIEGGTFVPEDFQPHFSYPAAGGGYKLSADTRATSADHGWLVTASVTYTDRAGRPRECRVQERFQYQPHPENPLPLEMTGFDAAGADLTEAMNTSIVSTELHAPPGFHREYTNPGDEPFYKSCSDGTTNRNVRLRVKNVRPGSVMMCRNLSHQRSPSFVASGPGQTVMNNTVAPRRNTFHSSELLKNIYYYDRDIRPDNKLGNMMIMGLYYPQGTYYCDQAYGCTGLPYFGSGTAHATNNVFTPHGSPEYQFNDSSANGEVVGNPAFGWMPCERLTPVCGIAINDTASGYKANLGAFDIFYQNLPDGCEVHLQIAEVDAGYNVRATEFREYMHEKVPGNWLCRANMAGTGPIPAMQWFFACGKPAGFGKCENATQQNQQCCLEYPTFPHYKAEHPSP